MQIDAGESIDACPACACNASSDIPCSRNLVKHVCRNMWHVNRGSPARPRTPSITSSSPAVVNGIPRRGPFSTTKHASVGTSDGRSDTKYSPSASKNRPETGTIRSRTPLPDATNSRCSPGLMSRRPNPSTSQRRNPANSIASTIARSRCVRNAPSSRSTSTGESTLGSVRGRRTSRTPPRPR